MVSLPREPIVRDGVMERAKVYVALLNEAVDVWRPVVAEPVAHDLYRLCGPMPDDETWEFGPGEIVRCEERSFHDGTRHLNSSTANRQ
jgi:hypothetical protein